MIANMNLPRVQVLQQGGINADELKQFASLNYLVIWMKLVIFKGKYDLDEVSLFVC